MSDRTIGAPTSGHAALPVADSGSLGDEPLSVSTQARLARFLSLDRLLADITLDQLRTLVLVREAGSALKASHALGREQSSIQKQLDALNRQFERACGEVDFRTFSSQVGISGVTARTD